jgi:hypothetical protein
MAMRASVSIYVLVSVIAHGELERLVVREVAQLAMNRVVFVQWKVTRLLPDLPRKVEVSILMNQIRFLIEVSFISYQLLSPMLGTEWL